MLCYVGRPVHDIEDHVRRWIVLKDLVRAKSTFLILLLTVKHAPYGGFFAEPKKLLKGPVNRI